MEDFEIRFDTSNFEIYRPLPKGKNEKVIGLMKDELGGQIMKEFDGLRAKTYSYLKDNNDVKKSKKNKKVCHKKNNIFLEKKKFNVDSLKEDKKNSQII